MTVRKSNYRTRFVLPAAVGLALTAALTVPAGATAAPAGSGQEVASGIEIRTSTPVGKWEGTVEHAQGSGNVTLSFHRSGVMCLVSGGGPEGGGSGKGAWKRTGKNTFAFQVKERLYEADGTTVGYVDVNQRAVQQGAAFASSGISKIYDADGTYLSSAEAKVKVSRVSTTPGAC